MIDRGHNSVKNILWGVKIGAGFGLLYCVAALVIFALQGTEPFEHNDVELPSVLVLYLSSGIVAGAIVGALRPLTRTKAGAMLVGVVAVTPLAFGIGTMLYGLPNSWSSDIWITVAIFILIFGPAGANTLWGKM